MAKYSELLLDTNFIVECGKRRLLDEAKALVPGAKVVTLQAVVDELQNKGERLAIEIIEKENIEVLPITGYVDKAIQEYVGKGGVAVATNDKALTKTLRENGVAIVFPTKDGCDLIGGIV